MVIILTIMKGRFPMRFKDMRLVCLVLMSLLVLTYGTGWSSRQLETNNVHLRGSSNVAGIAQQVAEVYMHENPDIAVTVTSIGTMRGIKSLIDATCNVAMASAESSDEQVKHAKDNDVSMTKHVIAHDALIPIVNPSNSIGNLSIEELRKVFSGEINNWEQLGAANQPISIVSYDGTSGNYETWKDVVMKEGKVVTPTAKIMSANDMKKFVQQNPGAIGYVGLPSLDNTIKTLAVEGVKADENSIKSNTYPICRELVLYTTKDSRESVNNFVKYFSTDKAQEFIKKAGVIPVK